MADKTTETARHGSGKAPISRAESVRAFVRENPLGTVSLIASIVLGSALCYTLLDAGLSDARRIIGGAFAGGGSWLCVYVGRAIG